ncbi:hypothetical protein JHK84_033749 [Glycine max]|nr:hypothetical protein JHK85_034129 [Glycine max]KAG5139981.1 hypothetical protein JHK84_033749 [Glycine max]
MCAFRVLCDEFFIIPITSKFLHHYNVKQNRKGGWVSLIGILNKAVIGPSTSSYKDFKGYFFRVHPGIESKLKGLWLPRHKLRRPRAKKYDHFKDNWVLPPPSIIMGVAKRVNSSQNEGSSKRQKVELVLIATLFVVESHLIFLSMKEAVSSLWDKDFNPCALIVRLEYAMEASLLALMDCILTTTKDLAKALQDEIECLNKEFALFKVNAKETEVKLNSDLNKAEAENLKTHEVSFFKATNQAKYLFKEADIYLSNSDKEMNHQGELVLEAEALAKGAIEEPTT